MSDDYTDPESKDSDATMLRKGDKVNVESAQEEFENLIDAWDLDDDEESMEEEDLTSYNNQKRRILRAIRQGRFHLNGDGAIEYTLLVPKFERTAFTLQLPGGNAYAKLDTCKEKHRVKQMFTMISQMAKQPVNIIQALDGRDLKVCQAVMALFLGS